MNAHVRRKFLFIFFLWNYAPFDHRNLAKIEYTTETVFQRNSSKPFHKTLCYFKVKVEILCLCAYCKKFLFDLIERKILIKHISFNVICGLAHIHELKWWRSCVSDYDFLFNRHHYLWLPFIMCSTFKQCWSVGYVSLLTLSFILYEI